jgi:hypothetical protein
VHIHRCLSGQQEPAPALRRAARELEALLDRAGLAGGAGAREAAHGG